MSNLSEIQIQEIKFLDELLDQVIILDKSKNICCANKSAYNRFGSKLEGKNVSSILRDAKLLDSIETSINQKKTQIVDVEIKKPNFQFYKARIIPGPSKLCNQEQSVIIFLKD